MIEDGQIADVQGERAAWTFLVDDHGHGTAFNALAESDATSAGETCVRKALQHLGRSYYNRPVISRSSISFVTGPMCFMQIEPLRSTRNVVGSAQSGPNAFSNPSCARKTG